MKDYKKVALERKIEGLEESGLEKTKILDMINTKRRIYKKPVLLLTVLIMVLTLSLWPKQQKDDFYIVKVNANEYYVNVFEDGLQFDIYTLVENDIVKFNDMYSYYEGMKSHVDVSDKTIVKAHEFNGIKVLEVTIGEAETIYLEVYENDNIRTIKEIEFEFTDFKEELNKLSEMLEMYPPKEKVSYDDENTVIHTFDYNEDVIGSPKEIKLYKWYVDGMKYIYDLRMTDYDLDRYALLIYMNGSKNDIESIKHLVNSLNPQSTEPFLNNPLIVNGDELDGLRTVPIEENDIRSTHYLDLSHFSKEVGYSTLIVDFSDSKYNVVELDIEVTIGNNIVNDEDMLIIDNTLYVFPQKCFANDNGEIDMVTDLRIMDNEEVIMTYSDYSTHYYQTTQNVDTN